MLDKFLMENGMTLETLPEIKKAKFIEYSTICDIKHTVHGPGYFKKLVQKFAHTIS